MFKTQKIRILTAIILVISVMAVSVSADFINVDKYGLYDLNHKLISLGNSLRGSYTARWALSGLSPDYTYDCWYQINFVDNIVNNYNIEESFYLTSNKIGYFDGDINQNWIKLGVQLGSIEKISEKSIKIHLYWSHSISNHYDATLCLAQKFFINSGGIKSTGQGVGVYYDPGGSNYEEILNLINQNVEDLPSRIKQVLEQHDEELKSEASTEGAGRVEAAKEALQNALPVSAVKDAITPIITACGYNGTDSKWQFPAMSIPAIPGLFDEIHLTDAQDIDLTAYATLYIPETLLMLVRSLLTAGLIMFAIKDLMSLAGSIFGDEHKGGSG